MSHETKVNKQKRKHIFPELSIASAKCMLLGLHATAILRTFKYYPCVPCCYKTLPRVANGPETETSSFCWAHLSIFHLKTETESNL
jgi:hypothetical protein